MVAVEHVLDLESRECSQLRPPHFRLGSILQLLGGPKRANTTGCFKFLADNEKPLFEITLKKANLKAQFSELDQRPIRQINEILRIFALLMPNNSMRNSYLRFYIF